MIADEEYVETELTSKLNMSVEYFNGVLYEQIPLIVQTLYSCIYMKSKVIVCATGDYIQPSIGFVQDLNQIAVPDTGAVAAVSLNSDIRMITYFQMQEGLSTYKFSGQFESVVKEQDLLFVIPSNSSNPELLSSLENLIKAAKDQNIMIIMLSCNQNDGQLTKYLSEDNDIYLQIGDGSDYVSSIQILITLQSILSNFKEFKNNN